MDDELRRHLQAMEQRTAEKIPDAQTEILRGFERYLKGINIRLRLIEADAGNLKTAD